MSKALYRKYRPKSLSEVVGQDEVTKVLANSLEQNKISHAYLFVGPRGTGKTSVARIFAHAVNGFEYEIEDNYVDIIEIDGASNRGIDNIRELREKAMVAPTSGKYKVYIIDEVHMLTKEAFNALLKTLEEPPRHVIFIMATTDAYKVPVTITSRAQTYTFKLASVELMSDFLKNVAKKEKINITDDAINIIAKRGGGSFRDSLSLLDQISTLSKEKITKELVISAMGLPEDEKISDLLASYSSGNLPETTNLLKELFSVGIKPETIAEEIIAQIISNPEPGFMSLLSKLTEVKAPFAEAKLLVALSNDKKQTKPKEINSEVNFSWEQFVNKVKELNDAVYSQLIKTSHEFIDGTLHIYPNKKFVKTILIKDNNKRILDRVSKGIKIEIHDADEKPNNAAKDEVLSKISDIMGGEVQDGGGNPFEK